MDTVINSTPNPDISKKAENRFFFIKLKISYIWVSSCVLNHVTQGLKSELCKHLGKKSGFDAKVTFCYFPISS